MADTASPDAKIKIHQTATTKRHSFGVVSVQYGPENHAPLTTHPVQHPDEKDSGAGGVDIHPRVLTGSSGTANPVQQTAQQPPNSHIGSITKKATRVFRALAPDNENTGETLESGGLTRSSIKQVAAQAEGLGNAYAMGQSLINLGKEVGDIRHGQIAKGTVGVMVSTGTLATSTVNTIESFSPGRISEGVAQGSESMVLPLVAMQITYDILSAPAGKKGLAVGEAVANTSTAVLLSGTTTGLLGFGLMAAGPIAATWAFKRDLEVSDMERQHAENLAELNSHSHAAFLQDEANRFFQLSQTPYLTKGEFGKPDMHDGKNIDIMMAGMRPEDKKALLATVLDDNNVSREVRDEHARILQSMGENLEEALFRVRCAYLTADMTPEEKETFNSKWQDEKEHILDAWEKTHGFNLQLVGDGQGKMNVDVYNNPRNLRILDEYFGNLRSDINTKMKAVDQMDALPGFTKDQSKLATHMMWDERLVAIESANAGCRNVMEGLDGPAITTEKTPERMASDAVMLDKIGAAQNYTLVVDPKTKGLTNFDGGNASIPAALSSQYFRDHSKHDFTTVLYSADDKHVPLEVVHFHIAGPNLPSPAPGERPNINGVILDPMQTAIWQAEKARLASVKLKQVSEIELPHPPIVTGMDIPATITQARS